MTNKLFRVLSMLFLSLLVLIGCGTTEEGSKERSSNSVTVTDSTGEVSVPMNPEKVVVFDMGSLDTIKSLGKSDVVIGAPTKSIPAYLDSFKEVESVGGMKEPDLEKINQLKPDLIIISGRQESFKEDLEAIAPVLYLSVDNTKTWESTKANINTLATIFDATDIAKEKIETLEKDIATINEKASASGLKSLVTLVNEGKLSAYGEQSRFGIIHDTFGFPAVDPNIEASTHGNDVSYEYVLDKNPDVIFVIDRTKAIGGDLSKNNVAENELVKQTTAGKNEKVISLTPDVWYLSGGGIECTELMISDVEAALK
ncbi:siderophore ABC transporter substrate-binding protein [Vagococcus coleopterorum]|uniref:Siderophore ABC transporter substrate-binding protein n=1 Tax=Vagococcus coleopterorum TaxID=2714946 RepID=A0A6G8ALY6_9ENTE|nr:siderophore ABC transporter substrate-binding protein [Vagococcus coleopterorum]QIL46091.1 siderophore ABC transporter substrate-binding protein [Vagococcus coleopterorum]